MAINTAERRHTTIGVSNPIVPRPAATGVDSEDRASLWRTYKGFLTSTPDITGWDDSASTWDGPASSVKGWDDSASSWD